jgi:hypothetical protein
MSATITHWKVGNPTAPNNITQMKSGEYQPRFIAGGNQVAYYLGLRGNNITSPMPTAQHYSTYESIIKGKGRK